MEADKEYASNVHHGLNVKRARIKKGMKQEELAFEACTTQQNVSLYEAKKVIESEMLERFAKALNVPVEELEYTNEEGKTVIIENNKIENTENNTFENADKLTVNTTTTGYNTGIGFETNDSSTNTFNPFEKLVQIYDEKTALYEQLLKVEREKNTLLEQQLLATQQKPADKQ